MNLRALVGALALFVLLTLACLSMPIATPTSVPPATTTKTTTPAIPFASATSVPESGFSLLPSKVNRDVAEAAQNPSLAVAGDTGNVWIAWAENSSGGLRQIFVDEIQNNEFLARGASLNVHLNVVADQVSITFAGPNKMTPWVAWSEPSPGFQNVSQIFASKFNRETGLWQVAGQDRGGSEPSLNFKTDRTAEHPAIVGGTTDPTNPPVPWIAWEEDGTAGNKKQIYVARGFKVDTAIGGLQWHMVGELNRNNEPSLNVDPLRDARHPSLAFAEEDDTVPWITWFEQGSGRPSRVFAARGTFDDAAPGGIKWLNVPFCGDDELNCSLNTNPLKDALDPTIAAGSVEPNGAPMPWIAWTEVGPSGKGQIFVSRLDPVTQKSFLNVGASLNVDQNHDAKTPMIVFLGSVPYVVWLEDDGTGNFAVQVRHLSSDPQTGTWSLDSPPGGLSAPSGFADLGLAVAASNALILSWPGGDPGIAAPPLLVGQFQP